MLDSSGTRKRFNLMLEQNPVPCEAISYPEQFVHSIKQTVIDQRWIWQFCILSSQNQKPDNTPNPMFKS